MSPRFLDTYANSIILIKIWKKNISLTFCFIKKMQQDGISNGKIDFIANSDKPDEVG